MNQRVLITGANGRLGQAAIKAFSARGWAVNTLVRRASGTDDPRVTEFTGDATDSDSLLRAAVGCDVIIPAANPSYELWQEVVPATTQALITVAASIGATIVLPGNIYAYGDSMPAVIQADTPHNPSCQYGEIRSNMELDLQTASRDHRVQTLVVRAGGYLDGRDTGNWFESHMCKNLHKNQFLYPGHLDVDCSWAYLPDVADVMVRVAEIRNQLEPFDDIGFPGYSITGAELHNLVEAHVNRTLKLTSLPWFVIKMMSWFMPMMKGVYDMRYLFHVPHSIDGSRLEAILPNWTGTPIDMAMSTMLANLEGHETDAPTLLHSSR